MNAERDPEIVVRERLAILRILKEFRGRAVRADVWDSRCPAHDDRSPSMRTWRDADGRLRFKCYAGCSFNDVRQALGLPTFGGHTPGRTAPVQKPQPKTKSDRYNFPALAGKFAADGPTLAPLSRALGVSVASLLDADVGRCYAEPMFVRSRGEDMPVSAWTFPMVDAAENVTGLRLRSVKANKRGEVDKFSWTDSTPGLFFGRRWLNSGPILVVEGPTDRAAAFDWGYDAVGVPSCNDGADLVLAFLRRIRPLGRRDVVVIANRDEAKPRDKSDPSKGVFFPGQDGARALAELIYDECRGRLKVLTPPQWKDCRKWKTDGGATRAQVDAAIANRNVYLRRKAV